MPTAPPPLAPIRAITQEAQISTPAKRGEADLGGIDYGTEISLPNEIPPSTPEPVAAARPLPQPVVAAARSVDAPVSAPIAAPLSQPLPPARAASPASPAARPRPLASQEIVTEADGNAVVVPVTLPPRGQTAEIVIRIILKSE